MLLTIANVLNESVLEQVHALIMTLRWKDGAETAGATAREVKHNQQADLTSRTGAELRDLLVHAVSSNSVLKAAAQPSLFSKLLICKTERGGGFISNREFHTSRQCVHASGNAQNANRPIIHAIPF